jgi:BirA family biotin operon repressor/biotin-[acetyl-CoA-carboxylase] ligase
MQDDTGMALADWAAEQGGRFIHLNEVTSTSDYLRTHWPELQREGVSWSICLADRQTAGRGRQGHAWHSAAGAGLWCSLAVPVAPWVDGGGSPMTNALAPPLSLVLAAALIDVLRMAGFPVQLKWPNDLWLADRKIGGLLIEQLGSARNRYWLVGFGINWQAPLDLPRDKIGGVVDAGGLFDRSSLMIDVPSDTSGLRDGLTYGLCRRALDTIQSPSLWSGWMNQANTFSALTGRDVQVWLDGIPQSRGRVTGIEPDGTMILMTDDGSIRVGGAASVRLLI